MKLLQFVCLASYYGFARYLPVSYSKPFGKISKKIRYYLCKNIFAKTGHNANIERGAYFGKGTWVEIGKNSSIGVNSHIQNNTIIGYDVMMGPNTYMLDNTTHNFARTDITMIAQGKKKYADRSQVIIGNGVWIGRDVMILGSKIIADGSIIGARTLLTKNFPPYSIIGGNPSKLIRSRLEPKD